MIIDTDNYAAANIETFTFAGGEHHCKIPKIPQRIVHIHAKMRSAYDWATLQVVCDALKREMHEIYLFLPYLPGARQDRVTSPGSPLTCAVYAGMLAQMVDHVTVTDIHSAEALKVLEDMVGRSRVTAMTPHWLVPELIRTSNQHMPDFVVAPDKGGVKRAQQAAFALGGMGGNSLPVMECTKERDPATGQLSKFVVPMAAMYDDEARYLIVDDICDGGGTFVGWLQEFRKRRPKAKVDLWVTHGIFSRGISALNGFDQIYTTDSFYQAHTRLGANLTDPNVHTLSLLPHYLEGLTP